MRFRRRYQSLGTQLILCYMIISVTVLSAASYYIYQYMLGIVKENNETLLLQQFKQLDHNIQGFVEDMDALSKFFLLEASVQRFLSYTPGEGDIEYSEMKKEVHSSIEGFVGNYEYLDSIYLVGEVQGAVGGTNQTTLIDPDPRWLERFTASPLFRRSYEEFPKMVVEGGIVKSDYNPYMLTEDGGHVFSMSRGVKALYRPQTRAVLVLNVDEGYISSLYSTELEEGKGTMYIMDYQGRIISSSHKEDIGQRGPFSQEDMGQASYGSFDHHKAGAQVQTVYYKLEHLNGYLMKEIPLNLFSEQIYSVQTMLVFVFLLCLIVNFVVSYFWLKRMTRPLTILAHKMQDMSRGELGVTVAKIPNNEFGLVIRRFNEMSLSIVDLLKTTNEIQEKRRELEIEALQSQINPHFLYNTLNMIRWMASGIKADNIVHSIVALGNMLRPVFASKDPMCTLRDEIQYLDNYIKITNWRFGNRIFFSIEVDELHLDRTIPRFILQPLVENSITFGGQKEGQAVHILIKTFDTDSEFMISVIDSGGGIEPLRMQQLNKQLQSGTTSFAKASGSGIGLYNVNKRIQLNYGEAYGIRLMPRIEGTEVQVRLPKPDEG